MITHDQIVPILLDADPAILPVWKQEQARFDEDGDLSYRVASFLWILESHLVQCLRENRIERFPAIFAAVERLIAEGDDDTQNQMVIGFFEDLQHQSQDDATLRCDVLLQYLGPASRGSWNWAASITGWRPSTANEG